MYRPGQRYDDGESLQADVMRFMAIIAFCLIAILALVKHAEPPEAEATTDSTTEPPPPVEPQPASTEEIQLALAPPPPVLPELDTPAPVPEAEPEPEKVRLPEPEPEPIRAMPSPALEAPPVVDEPVPAEVLPAAAPVPVESQASEDEGLILRFASDGDFLRLIARGDIRVYAFQDTDVLTLSESYRFLDTSSPGQVYELLPPSIPSLIVDALKQARTNIDGYSWGIALPGHISNQIEQHLGRVTQGQLVIDRYGDVHHVAAS